MSSNKYILGIIDNLNLNYHSFDLNGDSTQLAHREIFYYKNCLDKDLNQSHEEILKDEKEINTQDIEFLSNYIKEKEYIKDEYKRMRALGLIED
ncbi:hypothetical protein [Curvibacter gracilis]|uniref:hypothetical protein n=1 Tax=Curvibacter gracilis TaxID=230310 RepID=UPI0012FB5DD6|nr:hypothetical protein [Curvibacter gracilis]